MLKDHYTAKKQDAGKRKQDEPRLQERAPLKEDWVFSFDGKDQEEA